MSSGLGRDFMLAVGIGAAAYTGGASLGLVGAGAGADVAAGTTLATDATVGAGTEAAVTVAAPTAVGIAGAGAAGAGLAGTGVTASEALAAATGASALYTMAQGPKGINVPPAPSFAAQDSQVQQVEQQTLSRQQIAGGLQSTVGTPGGQAGAILSPSTTSSRAILGG
jgi:hypothetical protein